ncbi:MAG TPA: M1 family metallopeptidase [Nitrospira sp.]|nr:M1 family metallopeptidase [Nitrospira sp.]
MTQASSPGTLDPYRLPRHVVPTTYEIRLEPDLIAGTFRGSERISLTLSQPTSTIVFNAADLVVDTAVLEQAHGARSDGRVQLDEPLQRCTVNFPTAIAAGDCHLVLTFHGTLNDKLRGFYRSTYKDPAGKLHTMAATQFEATDARRAFPCWDEPHFKAIFAVTLVVDKEVTAISNSRVLSEMIESGKKVVHFADTIKMSTYLVAFIVGRIEGTPPILVGKTPLRLWSVPGKQGLTAFGRDIAAASLRFFEDYYGVPYPGDKLDLLAIPDFASGAMENLGAITFRETALLVDRQTATLGELQRIADVVAHENAHMWFGDLVTMSWWNGLWLNEAFATFMEMLAVDAWKPEWKRWETFSASRAAAFSVDGLHSTRPIEFAVRAPKDAEAMFDVLTYEKGASVLRMLEQHIGPAIFRNGVREYLRAHAYANADTQDLWVALGNAAKHDVPELMNAWIFQPGYPLVTAEIQGTELILRQQRFTYLPEPSSSASYASGLASPSVDPGLPPSTWHIPIQLGVDFQGQSETRRLLLTEKEQRVALDAPPSRVLLNEGGHGFYRVRYGPTLFGSLLKSGLEKLASVERFNFVSDAWAAAVAGLMPLEDYLDLTGRFTGDRDKNVWAVLIDSFAFLNRIIEPAHRPELEAFVRGRMTPAVSEVGWSPSPGENDLTRQLRSELIGALGRLGNDRAVQHRAEELYEQARQDPAVVDPNLMPALVSILAFSGDALRYDQFTDRFRLAMTPQEERRYLFSLAAFRQEALLERTLSKTLNGEIRVQDAPFIVSAVMSSVYGKRLGWEFVKTNWDRMDRLFPKQGLRRMCGGITGLASVELERDVREFFTSRKIDLGGKTLDQYLEQLRIVVHFKERHGPMLHRYLMAHH